MRPPQRLLGPYELLQRLGGSRSAEVYLARHRERDEHVAIKRLLPHAEEDPACLARFREEIELAMSLKHPGLVRGIEWFPAAQHSESSEALCLIMPVAEGDLLSALLGQSEGLIPPQDAVVHAASQLAHALSGLHHFPGGPMVHGDLSARNVCVAPSGQLTLLDLSSTGPQGEPTKDEGTPRYRAPERAYEGTLTTHMDVYAFGVLLWELCAGRRWPLEAPRRLPETSPLAGGALDTLISRCIASDPCTRPQDAKAILDALEPLVTTRGAQAWRAWLRAPTAPESSAAMSDAREGKKAWLHLSLAVGLSAWIALWFIAQMLR